jgi:hypothetical protein
MNVRLQDLVREIQVYKKHPPLKKHPEIRHSGAKIVRYILRNTGKEAIKRWEVAELHGKSILRIYFSTLHNNPRQADYSQPVSMITRASRKFDAPFRIFGEGNLICVEFEVIPQKDNQL